MKRLALLLTVLFVVILAGHTQIQTEIRTVLYPLNSKDKPLQLNPGKSFQQEVKFTENDYSTRRTLRVVGGIKMPGQFAPRGEENFRQQEYLIDDNLSTVETHYDSHSLYFRGENSPFEQHVYNRVTGINLKDSTIHIEIAHKRKNLKKNNDGDFGIELQLYYKKLDRHPDEIYDIPDSIIYIPIVQGSGNYEVLKEKIKFSQEIATILIRVGGVNFSGECWLEAPKLYNAEAENIFSSPFIPNDKKECDYNYWVGINMSTRSWPMWKLTFNDKTIFEGRIFDRASNVADFYITLPKNISGKGDLELRLIDEPHRASFPYEIRSVQLLEESAQEFEVVSVPKYISVGDTTAILIETNQPNVILSVSSLSTSINIIDGKPTLSNPGLHAVQVTAVDADIKIPLQFSSEKLNKSAIIEQSVVKKRDNVYLSSGDEIYIDKEYETYNRFFKWYLQNRIGNSYHFRPSYQWSGVRIIDEEIINHYTTLLNKMHMPYAWQVEGRTLAATRINPSIKTLSSPIFSGKQAHENDGGYYYWQHFNYIGLHSDMAARTRPYGGIFAKHRPIYTDYGIFVHYDPYGVTNMADGTNKFISNLSYSRGESIRHTGPSTMFRYLYQAGYEWLGAEQMYGPEDIIMSTLRGASKAYNKESYGSLHAVQWGSRPFTDPKHSLRFYMSLATAYMHGSSHINTEEGLWTDEYVNDRYTKAGKEHIFAQHQMLDYIETHSRKGEEKVNIAVIQGRNDAWKSFGRGPIWSQRGEKWSFNKAMESFDLLKVFYPDNIVNSCSTVGLFTSTPYGHIDILPIEATNEVLNQYKILIFLGWNNFSNTDFIRIKKFVEQGGTLLLTAAHLNSELQPHLAPRFPEDDIVIRTLLGNNYKEYSSRVEIELGKGLIIYYPQNSYPAEEEIRESYRNDMVTIASKIVADEHKQGWVEEADNINFSVWDSDDFRTVYILNTDWESDNDYSNTMFILNSKTFPIKAKQYSLATIRSAHNLAAMLKANTSDVLKIEIKKNNWVVTCQTTEDDELVTFNGLIGKKEVHRIDSAGIHKINISM